MGTAESIRLVTNIIRKNPKTVVVVSALSGVTNILLEAAEAGVKKRAALLRQAAERHESIIVKLIQCPRIQNEVRGYISERLSNLETFLRALSVIDYVNAELKDRIMAVGERLSARLLAGILEDSGTASSFVDLEKMIQGHAHANHAFFVAAERAAKKLLTPFVKKAVVPVCTGFFGKVPGSMLSSVGRGYSDFCASLLAAGLSAKELIIWTDVSGVCSADPRTVKQVKRIPEMSFDIAAELAHFGANIMHPQCIHPAIRAGVPVSIRNTFKPKAAGTRIVKSSSKRVVAVTCKKHLTLLQVDRLRTTGRAEFLAQLFSCLSKNGISVDAVSTSEVSVSIVVEDTPALSSVISALAGTAKVSIKKNRSLICLIGSHFAHTPGVSGRAFSALARARISVQQINQGAHETNIMALIDARHTTAAVQALHTAFIT